MTTIDIAHKDRAHSYVGGSTAKRVLNCPGSVNLCAQYPNVETVFAAEGTALHEAIVRGLGSAHGPLRRAALEALCELVAAESTPPPTAAEAVQGYTSPKA